MSEVITALWLFLPAAIGNATPVLANKVPYLNRWDTPIDFGRSYKGKRLLGNNKTWRGLVMGVGMAILAGLLQGGFSSNNTSLPMWALTGALLGFGALYGDAAESLLKRQKDIPSGKTWFPFDQIDYIVGGLIATLPLGIFDGVEIIAVVVGYFGLHLVATYIGYLLGLREQPI